MTSQETTPQASNNRRWVIKGSPLYCGGELSPEDPQNQGVAIRHTEGFPLKVDSGFYHELFFKGQRPNTVLFYVRDEETERQHVVSEDIELEDGLEIGTDYVDHMFWPQDRWAKFVTTIAGYETHKQMGLNDLFMCCSDETLLRAVSEFFEIEAVGVRVVYHYNVSSGYDCQRIDFIYKAQ